MRSRAAVTRCETSSVVLKVIHGPMRRLWFIQGSIGSARLQSVSALTFGVEGTASGDIWCLSQSATLRRPYKVDVCNVYAREDQRKHGYCRQAGWQQ